MVAAAADRPKDVFTPRLPRVDVAAVTPDAVDGTSSDEIDAAVAVPVAIEDTSALDGEMPRWPDETAESAFLSEQRVGGGAVLDAPRPAAGAAEAAEEKESAPDAPLPSIDALVQRIPAQARDTLEELFRARFVQVKRVPKAALK